MVLFFEISSNRFSDDEADIIDFFTPLIQETWNSNEIFTFGFKLHAQ